MKQRPPKKLTDGEFLVYEHALRCFCSECGSLLNWHCPEEVSYTETECCGFRYRLQPWTVKVHIEDVSSRPILPKMEGSNYADPDFTLTDKTVGSSEVKEIVSAPLSKAQLSWNMPTERPRVPEAPKPKPEPKSKRLKRKCGICRKPGHNRRSCPDA